MLYYLIKTSLCFLVLLGVFSKYCLQKGKCTVFPKLNKKNIFYTIKTLINTYMWCHWCKVPGSRASIIQPQSHSAITLSPAPLDPCFQSNLHPYRQKWKQLQQLSLPLPVSGNISVPTSTGLNSYYFTSLWVVQVRAGLALYLWIIGLMEGFPSNPARCKCCNWVLFPWVGKEPSHDNDTTNAEVKTSERPEEPGGGKWQTSSISSSSLSLWQPTLQAWQFTCLPLLTTSILS